jgi:glycosyltransferase involved in cell wall biosynthesis
MEGFSLVIPNHNGAKVIESSVREYYNVFSKKFKNFEMIVVCNGCTDNSIEICNNLAKKFPLKVIEIPQRGKGHALIKGFNEAKFNLVGFLDADNPFDLDVISKMVDRLTEYDAVIATKYLRGKAKFQDSFLRRIISLSGSIFSRFVFGLKFKDTQAGAKFFRKELWEKIDRNFISTGFDFDIEFLYKVHKVRAKILESYVPLRKYEKFSTVRLKYLPEMVYRLFKLRFFK